MRIQEKGVASPRQNSKIAYSCGATGTTTDKENVNDGAAGVGYSTFGGWARRNWNVPSSNASKAESVQKNSDITAPNVTYPGNDPLKPPPGTEWRGNGDVGSKKGNYYNPKTGEWWHPDLNHPAPIGPHWDYGIRGSIREWRVFLDGRIELKQ